MADCGVASRRASETYIMEGRVKVNGRTVTEMGYVVDPGKDIVSVDGKRIHPPVNHGYYAFYKPRSVVSTVSDDRGRKTVADFFRNIDRRLFPVGRLDYDSEGLMIMTDDGEFALKASHPRYRVSKVYQCTVNGNFTKAHGDELLSGVDIGDDTLAKAAEVEARSREDGRSILTITLLEGRNRQIKRMLEAQGFTVLRLKRLAIGSLEMGDMKPGSYRRLSAGEVEKALKPYKSPQARMNEQRNAARNRNRR